LSGEKRYYVYIMASRSLNFYTGVTNSIYHRTLQHKSGEVDGFTKKYNINRLVYYEVFEHIGNAIAREKQIKAWTRAKRIALIKTMNPAWQDLAEGWGGKTELQIPRFVRDDKANESGASKGSQDEKHALNEQEAAQSKADSKKTA
jgi:putative endonuclease